MPNRGRKIVGQILIVIFTLYYVNISCFYHGHVINGITISHSHFHSQAHAEKGTHTDNELTLISILSSFQTLQATIFFIGLGVIFYLKTIVSSVFKCVITQNPTACISLRAPPFLF